MKASMTASALRLPASIKAEAAKLAAEDGTSLNQFVAIAVAEKISALRTARYFTDRKGKADWNAFDRFMRRKDGFVPLDVEGDQLPEDYQRRE